MFRDREDAARQLAERLQGRKLINPLVLGIPRGGAVIGAVLAEELGADLDVVLSRKLRAPGQPELAVGAVAEDGEVHLTAYGREFIKPQTEYLEEERRLQLAEIARRKSLFRAILQPAPVAGRSVIVTDDGIATGSTMFAALQTIRPLGPRDLIVAVPVLAPERLAELWRLCDEVVFLFAPKKFWAIGQFYHDFHQLEDEEVCDILRSFSNTPRDERYPSGAPSSHGQRYLSMANGTSKEAI